MIFADEMKIKTIRWLCSGNFEFNPRQDIIANEILFAPIMRRADLLIISKMGLHALEIKSEKDSLTRLPDQIRDYILTFDKTSLVLTKTHLKEARKIIPKKVGIILVENGTFRVVRRAKKIAQLDKFYLATFLNKNLMSKYIVDSNLRRSTFEIRELFSCQNSTQGIRQLVIEFLIKRYQKRFEYFLKDTQNDITTDDLCLLNYKMSIRRF